MLAHQAVELAREEVGHPRDPGIRRLGGDHVVALPAGQKTPARVVDHEGDARIVERPAVLRLEEARRADDGGGDLDHLDPVDRMPLGRAERDPARQPDHEDRRGLVAEQQGEMGGEELGSHVAARRGLGLAVNLQGERPDRAPADRHESFPAVLFVDDGAAPPHRLAHPAGPRSGAVDRPVEKAAAAHEARVPRGECGDDDRDGHEENGPARDDPDERAVRSARPIPLARPHGA